MSPLSLHSLLLEGTNSCGLCSDHNSFDSGLPWFSVSCLEDVILQMLLQSYIFYILSVPFSELFLEPYKGGVNFLNSAEPSTTVYSQHLMETWVTAKYFCFRLRIPFVCGYKHRYLFHDMTIDLRSHLMWS